MQSVSFDWLGHEWTALRAEGVPNLDVEAQTTDLLTRLNDELMRTGLSLADTMRTRLWARDRDSRDRSSRVRAATFAGPARSASSSFISADHLDSEAAVALELWAMRPSYAEPKMLVEYEPQIVPLRYLERDSVVVLSGVTSVLPSLSDQTAEILAGIEGTLALAGVGWQDVVKMSCILHRSQDLNALKSLLVRPIGEAAAGIEYGVADGYSTPGKLVEIEVTALQGRR